MTLKTAADHITVSPEIRSGKPHITGRRITVADVVVWHEWLGRDADEIATEHDLSLAAIYAALAFYYDNRDLIDASFQDRRALAERLRRQTPSRLPPAL